MIMEGDAVPEKPNDNSQKSRSPNFLPCWPPAKTTSNGAGTAKNPFDELAAAQKEAKRKAIEYRSKIGSGLSDTDAIESFLFFAKNQGYDKQGRLRKRLLRQVSDVALVSIFDICTPMPIILARLIEGRFRPQATDRKPTQI
jgi:hypothetical protein